MQNQIFDDDRDTGSKVDAQFENYGLRLSELRTF